MTNPNQEEKLWMLFDMQEHPERYTDEQVAALLADPDIDDLFRSMALARMAQQKGHPGKVDVDEAWTAFASAHRLPTGHAQRPSGMLRKIVASVICVVGLSAIALAAIHIGLFRTSPAGGGRQTPVEQSVALADTARTDNALTVVASADSLSRKPVVFDNAELGTVVTQLAAFYHTKVVFENEEARHIRVFFNWDKTKTLSQNLDILNAFERIQIMEDHGTLKVK